MRFYSSILLVLRLLTVSLSLPSISLASTTSLGEFTRNLFFQPGFDSVTTPEGNRFLVARGTKVIPKSEVFSYVTGLTEEHFLALHTLLEGNIVTPLASDGYARCIMDYCRVWLPRGWSNWYDDKNNNARFLSGLQISRLSIKPKEPAQTGTYRLWWTRNNPYKLAHLHGDPSYKDGLFHIWTDENWLPLDKQGELSTFAVTPTKLCREYLRKVRRIKSKASLDTPLTDSFDKKQSPFTPPFSDPQVSRSLFEQINVDFRQDQLVIGSFLDDQYFALAPRNQQQRVCQVFTPGVLHKTEDQDSEFNKAKTHVFAAYHAALRLAAAYGKSPVFLTLPPETLDYPLSWSEEALAEKKEFIRENGLEVVLLYDRQEPASEGLKNILAERD